jgi:hypothetical protein
VSVQVARDVDSLLERRQALEQREISTADLAARLRALRGWQAARLARTYADLRHDPRYGPATEFFLRDLYGAHDFQARDRQLARAWKFLRRWLPAPALQALGDALELDVLTRELDLAVASRLPGAVCGEASYASAYRAAGRREARERQIALIQSAADHLQNAVRHRSIGLLLEAAHAPAKAAGLALLQGFLERGYQAFRALPSVDDFKAVIRARETELMQRWFAGAGQ